MYIYTYIQIYNTLCHNFKMNVTEKMTKFGISHLGNLDQEN